MNRLASETSPYLRQHAANPVDWYPWGDDALARARSDDLPLFVSVGYSACHWCHVMAHESFEDTSVAAVLNERFVPVKVDREERPDVDAVYMEAVQAMTAHGGWPMSVFATPDGRPFFGGTYFPPQDRHGMPSFRRVLEAVDDAWRTRRAEVERQASALVDAIGRRMRLPAAGPTVGSDGDEGLAWSQLLDASVAELAARYDHDWGGFGPPPKFPQPGLVELCLRHHRVADDDASLAMATGTLEAMAAGGIYDHVGGGFARYSTDRAWTVPHFEKMLYDQAGLVRVYLHAWQLTGRPDWRQVVEETVGYVLRDLVVAGGGLAAAEDADSEGEEGRFYLWRPDDFAAAVGELADAAGAWYGVTDDGNFEGRTILRRPVGSPLERPDDIERARRRLFDARARRVRPGRDDKVLLEWNAMFGASLAEAAGAMGRTDWATAALGLAEFLVAQMRRSDGRWLRSWQRGEARHLAYAGDYAWVVDFFTRVAELTGKPVWLERAAETAHAMLELFGSDDGLLYTTGSDAPRLVVRPMEVLDGAVPSPSSVAAAALVRLGALGGDDDITAAGESLVRALAGMAAEHPLAAANAVAAGALAHGGITEVVVTGDRPDLVEVARARFEPTIVLAWGEPTASLLWEGRSEGLAYVCRRFTCRAPASTAAELTARLDDELEADRHRMSTAGAAAGPEGAVR